jgi:hypothetical protein
MSDTATATVTQLTERIDAYKCMSIGIQTFCWLLLFLVLSNLIVACVDTYNNTPQITHITYMPPKLREQFSPVKFPPPPQQFQRIPLTPPESTEASHLYFGTAHLHIIPKDTETTLIFEIYANLPIIGGNVFGKRDEGQFYSVQLIDEKTNKSMTSKDIKRDNDGMYKLKFTTTNQQEIEEMSKMKKVIVKHTINEKEVTLIEGLFH